jgi:RHS repeat-associated protein
LRPDSSGNVVANTAYNLLLDYFQGDYNPISTAAGPDSAVNTTLDGDYRPLYNGNISSMGARIRGLTNPLLYNYQYDQLNRLIHMDAWNRTGTPWSAITKISDFQESVAYDPNGNIQKYKRNGNSSISLGMDSLNYFYIAGTNKLDHITDSVTSTCSGCNDITTQSAGNYQYDSIGELTADAGSNITGITWTVYGKIASITKSTDTTIYFTYDAGGNRISKSVIYAGDTLTTWYTRDAQGNILSVYIYGDPSTNGKDLSQTELDIYGSSRLGMWKRTVNVQISPPSDSVAMPLFGKGDSLIFTRGNKLFELTNHLGNVLSTISDKRYGVSGDDSTVTYFNPEVVSSNDYYPFGMLQPGRQYAESNLGSYRYGFNGKEQDNEVKGVGNQIAFENRIFDPRIGRWFSVDPLQKIYPGESNYAFVSNSPILYADRDGKDKIVTITVLNKDGKTIQFQKITKGVYHYGHDATYDGFGFFYKQDIVQNLTVDNRNGGKITIDEAMKNPNTFRYSRNYTNMQEASAADFFVGLFEGENSESEGVKYGFAISANGKDPEWNEGLPKAGDGSEPLDLKEWLDFVGGLREELAPADLLRKGKKLKEILEKADQAEEAADKTAAAIERLKEVLGGRDLNHSADPGQKSYELPPNILTSIGGDSSTPSVGKAIAAWDKYYRSHGIKLQVVFGKKTNGDTGVYTTPTGPNGVPPTHN